MGARSIIQLCLYWFVAGMAVVKTWAIPLDSVILLYLLVVCAVACVVSIVTDNRKKSKKRS